MLLQTCDFRILDCNRIYISESSKYSGVKYTIQCQPTMEPSDRGSYFIELFQTFNAADARRLISLITAFLNDHGAGSVVPLPELIARLQLVREGEEKNEENGI